MKTNKLTHPKVINSRDDKLKNTIIMTNYLSLVFFFLNTIHEQHKDIEA